MAIGFAVAADPSAKPLSKDDQIKVLKAANQVLLGQAELLQAQLDVTKKMEQVRKSVDTYKTTVGDVLKALELSADKFYIDFDTMEAKPNPSGGPAQ